MPATEVVAAALNEQGFLFQYKMLDILRQPAGSPRHQWKIEAAEVPVSLNDDRQTRIDIVLRHGASSSWRAVIECKRSARDYKRWVFFGGSPDGTSSSKQYLIETADLAGQWDNRGEPKMTHRVDARPQSDECPIFEFYVETKLNRPGSPQRASATEAIEDAFRQVILGQVGLAQHLRATHNIKFRLIPIVVTTAQVFSATFDSEKVSLNEGMIEPEDLTLSSRRWLAVNYHLDDTVANESGFSTNRAADLAEHLASWQVRTVFVVEAPHVQEFLAWIAVNLGCDA